MIELNERVIGMWYIQLTPDQDFLSSLFTTEEGELKGVYRFRYYKDDKTFHSDDQKNWYSMTITDDTISESVEKFRLVFNKLRHMSGTDEAYEILMDENGVDDFMERFAKLPFVHVQALTPEEAKAQGYLGGSED